MMKRKIIYATVLSVIFSLSACGTGTSPQAESPNTTLSVEPSIIEGEETEPIQSGDVIGETEDTEAAKEEQRSMLQMTINDTAVQVEWEDNESVSALQELCAEQPLTIQMSMYGGFEQVGSIGKKLPRNDKQTVTEAGDIVLYAGNQMVVFYGSNSWAYTRLGRITDKTADEMTDLLSNGDVTIVITIKE